LRFSTATEFRTQVEAVTGTSAASKNNKLSSPRPDRGVLFMTFVVGGGIAIVLLITFLAMRARQNGALATEALRALAEQKAASFTPTIERVLSLPEESAETCAVDLESGKFVPVPEEVREAAKNYFGRRVKLPESADRMERWAAATGADLMLIKAEPKITVALYGGGVAFPGFSFSKTGHVEVARLVVEIERHRHGPAQPQSPQPFVVFEQPELDRDGASKAIFFQTREGGNGLLQVVGSADGSNQVRIRFKLVGPPVVGSAGTIPRSFQIQQAFALNLRKSLR
jgi:hypothetical protein